MKAVKKMSGSTSFTNLPDIQKKCLVHNRVECQTEKFLSQVWMNCKCIPWAFNTNKTEQICGPDKDSCIAEQSLHDRSCLVPCTGIYADITEELFLQKLRREHSSTNHVENQESEQASHKLENEYMKYKRDYVKQVWFDPNEPKNLSKSLRSKLLCTFRFQGI